MCTMDARDREDYILDAGSDRELIKKRMDSAIEWCKPKDGAPVDFSLLVNTTKMAQLIKTSHGYKVIVDREFPNHCIDIVKKTK